MTESRNRPAQGPKAVSVKPLEGKPDDRTSSKSDADIPDRLNGFSHATPGKSTDVRAMDDMKLHQTLKHLLSERNLSARQAAKACGVPLSTFNSYLQHKKQIDPEHVVAIAKYFRVTIDYLITGKMPPEDAFKNLPTKKIFSKWVKLTLEDLDEIETNLSTLLSENRK